MPIDFRRAQPAVLTFPPTTGRVQTQQVTATFNSRVLRAEILISAFDIGYTSDDHHVFRTQIVPVQTGMSGPTVTYDVNYLFRDSSGNIDDAYNGSVVLVVVAEVE